MADRGQSAPRLAVPNDTMVVALVAIVAGASAGFASAQPTGAPAWDAFLKATLVIVVVFAASKAPRWVMMVMAITPAALAGLTIWGLFGWISLLLATAAALLSRRNRPLNALAAGLACHALLHLPAFGFFGLQSLIAGGVFCLVFVGGYRYGNKRTRQIARRAVAGISVAVVALLLLGGISLIDARGDVDRGVAAARRGLVSARSGDTVAVSEELAIAEAALVAANERVSSRTSRTLRLLPVAAQHHRAIETATSAGSIVASRAASAARDADIETISLTSGSVDLAALRSMGPLLRSTADALRSAIESISSSQSGWVAAPVRDRVSDLKQEIESLLPEVDIAAEAAEIVPAMLGEQGKRTYFIMFGTPAESRELGGFLGSWALISFDEGQLRLGESGRIVELFGIAGRSEVSTENLPEWYLEMGRPTQFPQNLPGSPDFGTVADAARQVLGESSEDGIDGFVYLDAHALSAFIELTGAIQLPFRTAPLTVDNAGEFFFEDQYRFEVADRTEVFDQLAEAAAAVVERLGQQTLPGPEELGRVLGPAARGGHLQVITFNEAENEFLRSTKLLRDFARTDTTDFVALVQSNALSNKMDIYLHRTFDYRAEVASGGAVVATATATLRSLVPQDAPEVALGGGDQRANNKVLLSLYTPYELISVTVNGESVPVASTREFGLQRYLIEVLVEPTGEPYVVEYNVAGAVSVSEPYSLEVWHQPLVNSDEVNVSVTGPGQAAIDWSGSLVESVVLGRDGE